MKTTQQPRCSLAGLLMMSLVTIAGCASSSKSADPNDSGDVITRVVTRDGDVSQVSTTDVEVAAALGSPFRGRPAPDFELADHQGATVRLSELRGKWVVLYFYPKDDTPGCVCQATEFTELITTFANMNATLLGISGDTPASQRRFHRRYNLAFPLLSDADHAVMTRYGAWVSTRLGDQTFDRMIRSTFIVDPQGTIAWHWPEVVPQGHAKRVSDRLEQLQRDQASAPR